MGKHLVKYFMWEWQHTYRIAVEEDAKRVFGLLDPSLRPRVFLIGVRETDAGVAIVGFEPDDCGYGPSMFEGLENDASIFLQEDPEREVFYDHAGLNAQHVRQTQIKALHSAIETRVRLNDESRGGISFCSPLVSVGEYRVSVVLQFVRETYDSHYSLAKREIELGRTYYLHQSLINSAMREFFAACATALSLPNPSGGISELGRDEKDIVLKAGRALMTTPGLLNHDFMASRDLYDAMTEVAALRYERAEGIGKILIVNKSNTDVEPIITLASRVPLRDRRAIRKLLQLSTEDIYLLSDATTIYGLGRSLASYDPAQETLFTVRFLQHHVWELVHDDHVLMRVSYGRPSLPQPPLASEKFANITKRFFREALQEDIHRLWALVQGAIRQERGALIVISPNAAGEANRLTRQCTPITPMSLTPEFIRMVTSIDGAVLLDVHAHCYAIGVILDGTVTSKGDPGRGSRYNSAVFYSETRPGCLIVVVSEDGTVDLVPDPRPRIKRSLINAALKLLRDLYPDKAVKHKEFNQVMTWLDRHRFYLSSSECTEINTIFPAIQDRYDDDVRIMWEEFEPNSDMNETYFEDEGAT